MKQILVVIFIVIAAVNLSAQTRIAVLPFTNMDGNARYNIWCYNLQDSIASEMRLQDLDEMYYRIVPSDSVENILSEMNLDPANPQYLSDMWLAVEKLNVQHVISGNFKVQANRFLINAYIYNVATKIPLPDHQVRDIFKREEKIFEAVPIIVRNLKQAYISE